MLYTTQLTCNILKIKLKHTPSLFIREAVLNFKLRNSCFPLRFKWGGPGWGNK